MASHTGYIDGAVQSWAKVEGRGGGPVLPGRVKSWLERNGFASEMYAAHARLDVQACPPTPLAPGAALELELEDADDDARRIALH